MFFWYQHAGYREAWENPAWHDPSMRRPFKEYYDEAVESGWWQGVDYPKVDQPPRVLIECGGNVLRRTRGGTRMLLRAPLARTHQGRDDGRPHERNRGLQRHRAADVPAVREDRLRIPSTHVMNLTFCDKSVDPPGECVDEWEAYRRIAEKVQQRARERDAGVYRSGVGLRFDPQNMHDSFTADGLWTDPETMIDEMLRDTASSARSPRTPAWSTSARSATTAGRTWGSPCGPSARQPTLRWTRRSLPSASTWRTGSR
ncbi:MAG: hypothetical protein M5U19_14840, partial [Microthrixaceae bacterium]|nr:hypothetical protein [Microthrixaceae bacterium]